MKRTCIIMNQITRHTFRTLKAKGFLFHCPSKSFNSFSKLPKRPVVIGGSNLDIVVTSKEDFILDGRLLDGFVTQCCGGVGRNIADALAHLNKNPLFISAIGNDQMGEFMMDGLKHVDNSGILRTSSEDTASCCVLVDRDKECKGIIGNMSMHSKISLEWVQQYETNISQAGFVILDGNVRGAVVDFVLSICGSRNIPVWFEPTDLAICALIFESKLWEKVSYMSPNFYELRKMASVISGKDYSSLNPETLEDLIKNSITLAKHIPIATIMVTLGRHGMVMISGTSAQYYKALDVTNIQNVSGAGDCAVAGYIAAYLEGKNKNEMVGAALHCAKQSLGSTSPVPVELALHIPESTQCRDVSKLEEVPC